MLDQLQTNYSGGIHSVLVTLIHLFSKTYDPWAEWKFQFLYLVLYSLYLVLILRDRREREREREREDKGN